jgi:hypothetical protein
VLGATMLKAHLGPCGQGEARTWRGAEAALCTSGLHSMGAWQPRRRARWQQQAAGPYADEQSALRHHEDRVLTLHWLSEC